MQSHRSKLQGAYRRLAPPIAFLFLTVVILLAIQLVFGGLYSDRVYDGLSPLTRDAVRNAVFRAQLIVALVAAAFAAGALFRQLRFTTRLQKGFAVRLGGGVFAGLAATVAVVGLIWTTSDVTFSGATAGGRQLWVAGAVALGIAVLVSISEELLCRGFLLRSLTSGFGRVAATIVTSLFFVLLHAGNGVAEPLWYFNVMLFGVVFAWSVLVFGSLAWAIGFHASWNWAESFIFGLANSGKTAGDALLQGGVSSRNLLSGGAAGPEGSVFTTLVLFGILIALAMKRGGTHVAELG